MSKIQTPPPRPPTQVPKTLNLSWTDNATPLFSTKRQKSLEQVNYIKKRKNERN